MGTLAADAEACTRAVHAEAVILARDLHLMGEVGDAHRCGDDLAGMCGYAADALARLLRERGHDAVLAYGGTHAWARCGGLACDPTSLQFGGEPWRVVPADHPGYAEDGTAASVTDLPWHAYDIEEGLPHAEKAPLLVKWLLDGARQALG